MFVKVTIYTLTASSFISSAFARPALAWPPTSANISSTPATAITASMITAAPQIVKCEDSDSLCLTQGIAIECSWTSSGASVPSFSTTQGLPADLHLREATSTSSARIAERTVYDQNPE